MFSILIVEDNKIVAETIRDLIDWERLGVIVCDMCYDGRSGYEAAVREKPDFVLTDVDMPFMNGIDMAAKIKESAPGTKFLFISCFDEFEYIKDAMDLDAYRYVLKPLDYDEIAETVKKLAEDKRNEMDRESEMHGLKKQLQKNLPLLQVQLFKSLLLPEPRSLPELYEEMRYLQIRCEKRYAVAYIEIDGQHKDGAPQDIENRYLQLQEIRQTTEKHMNVPDVACYLMDEQMFGLAYIIFSGGYGDIAAQEGDIAAQNRIFELLERIKDDLHGKRHTVTIALSGIESDILSVKKHFNAVCQAIQSKFYSGTGKIILPGEYVETSDNGGAINAELVINVKNVLESEDENAVKAFTDLHFAMDNHLNPLYVRGKTFVIISLLQSFLLERSIRLADVFESDTIIWNKLLEFESILDIRQWIINVLQTSKDYIKTRNNTEQGRSRRYEKITVELMERIRRNYYKYNSVAEIVSGLYISVSHANFIFKSQTGKTIFDYLIETRMEAAKDMLRDPYCKVYEVAEKTGYKNIPYFVSVFKDYTGSTPKQYANTVNN